MSSLNQVLWVAVGASLAYLGPVLLEGLKPSLGWTLGFRIPEVVEPWSCGHHEYTTQLISLEPLLVYIHNFVSLAEAELIAEAGGRLLEPSPVTGYGTDGQSQARTSWSAPLAGAHPAVECVLARAESFMGTLMAPGRDDMGVAQMVHYTAGQKFDLHHDWFQQPRLRDGDEGRQRLYNRVATFFVILQANCTHGETYFPAARAIAPQDRREGGNASGFWREHEDGGLAFKPIPGNALFWINLFPNGTGDARTLHAGLPVEDGTKAAMNIWPRAFFGPEA